MRAYNSFNKFDNSQSFWSWIATIANNHCIDVLRKASRTKRLFGDETQELEQLAETSTHAPNVLVEGLIRTEDESALNEAVANLPDKYRIPIVLAYFNHLSYDAIADQLDVSKTHVGVLLLRGKKRIRQAMLDTAHPADPPDHRAQPATDGGTDA